MFYDHIKYTIIINYLMKLVVLSTMNSVCCTYISYYQKIIVTSTASTTYHVRGSNIIVFKHIYHENSGRCKISYL